MPPRQKNLNRSIAKAMSALIASVILLSGQTAVAAPQYNMEERAFAIAGPSLVYLEMNAKGFLRRKDNGEAVHPSAIGFTFRCSGFVVTNAGHVISSTRCVSPEPDSLRSSAVGQSSVFGMTSSAVRNLRGTPSGSRSSLSFKGSSRVMYAACG